MPFRSNPNPSPWAKLIFPDFVVVRPYPIPSPRYPALAEANPDRDPLDPALAEL